MREAVSSRGKGALEAGQHSRHTAQRLHAASTELLCVHVCAKSEVPRCSRICTAARLNDVWGGFRQSCLPFRKLCRQRAALSDTSHTLERASQRADSGASLSHQLHTGSVKQSLCHNLRNSCNYQGAYHPVRSERLASSPRWSGRRHSAPAPQHHRTLHPPHTRGVHLVAARQSRRMPRRSWPLPLPPKCHRGGARGPRRRARCATRG